MKKFSKSILAGLAVLGVTGVAQGQILVASAPTASYQNYMNYWRVSARKNFFEGFCVGQALAGQQVVVQQGHQLDQATVNAFKSAIAACKNRGRNGGQQNPPVNAGNGPIAPTVPAAPTIPTSPIAPVAPTLPVTS